MAVIIRQPAFTGGPHGPSLPSETRVPRAMPPILGTFDLTAVLVLLVISFPNIQLLVQETGASALLFLLVGWGCFFAPGLVVAAQLADIFPHEGALYNWAHKVFGRGGSTGVACCHWLLGVLVLIGSGAGLVSYLRGINRSWLVQPWQQGLVILALLSLSALIAARPARRARHIVNGLFCLLVIAVLLIGLAGAAWFLKGHALALQARALPGTAPTGGAGSLALLAVAGRSYLGMYLPATCAAELRGRYAMRRSFFWGGLLVLFASLVPILALLLWRGSPGGSAPASLAGLVAVALGPLAGGVVNICVLAASLGSAVVITALFARQIYVAAVDDSRLPTRLGSLNTRRVPAAALLYQLIATAVVGSLVYLVIPYAIPWDRPVGIAALLIAILLAVGSLLWTALIIVLHMTCVTWYLRNPGAFRAQLLLPLPILLASLSVGTVSCLIIVYSLLNTSSLALGGIPLALLFAAIICARLGGGRRGEGGGGSGKRAEPASR